jgi:glycosyltransferase involved in cell wall biosynthesis
VRVGRAPGEHSRDEPPLALILVRNTVTGDSRVFREAATLRGLGFDVLIAGVVSAEEHQTELRLNGFRVVRLTPAESMRRFLRRRRESRSHALPRDSDSTAPGARVAEQRLAVLRRLVIASAYYLQGIALVRRVSPAVVHANDYNTMWIGVAAKVLCRSRIVYDAHELWPDRYQRPEWRPWLLAGEWLFLRLADANVTVSPGCAEVMARRYGVAPPLVVRNVPERVVVSPARAEGLRAGRAPLAVYIGGLVSGRGIEETIEALPAAPELRLLLMGRGLDEYRARLERVAARLGVADRVEYRPPIEPADVVEAISGADMGLSLIQPICLSNELSLPNKLFEYTAAGLPVVASDLPVLGAVIREEGIGVAVPPTDIDAIAQAMRDLADPERNAEARARVRSFADRVTWEQERRLLEAVYAPPSGVAAHG